MFCLCVQLTIVGYALMLSMVIPLTDVVELMVMVSPVYERLPPTRLRLSCPLGPPHPFCGALPSVFLRNLRAPTKLNDTIIETNSQRPISEIMGPHLGQVPRAPSISSLPTLKRESIYPH